MHKKKDRPDKKQTMPPGCRGRVWIDGSEGTFFGYGRAVLLGRIREHGSITKAAQSMGMSYRHAWELVDSMNRQSGQPLVETATGGKGGGGTFVTKEGERVEKLFWQFYKDFQEFLNKQDKKLNLFGKKSYTKRKYE